MKAALAGLTVAGADTSLSGMDAGETGGNEPRIKVNLILCLMRGEGNEVANEETVEVAKKYLVSDGGVVAIDLAGAEALFPTAKYVDIFQKAKKDGVPFTIHAGEADGASSVRDALEAGTVRIGHGVRSFEDKKVIDDIIRKNIPLEMCPTSNRQTHAVADMSTYPLVKYLEQGVCVTVNTDDPAIEGTTIAEEFAYLKKTYGLTEEQQGQILKNSITAAFTTETEKARLREIVFSG